MSRPTRTDVLVVGAGPAGSAAAAWAARAGLDTLLVDAAVFPRDKTCGDGLTPRAIGRAGAAGPRRLAACPHRQPGPARPRLRADPAAAVAGRLAARLGLGRGPHRARRPPAHHRDQGRRGSALDGARAVDVRRDGDRVVRRRAPRRRRRVRGRLRPAGRGRRRPLPAGQAAGPRVAPRHRLRRGRPVVRRLHHVRRPLDQLPPRAAGRGRRDPVRLRLGVPARQRLGQPRRRHARHRASARRRPRSSR